MPSNFQFRNARGSIINILNIGIILCWLGWAISYSLTVSIDIPTFHLDDAFQTAKYISGVDGNVLRTPVPFDDSFYLTDVNWMLGIARKRAGFFVPNTQKFIDEYKTGRLVRFADGEAREIIEIAPSGLYLNIYLNGDPLNQKKVGLPTKFMVLDKADYNSNEGGK